MDIYTIVLIINMLGNLTYILHFQIYNADIVYSIVLLCYSLTVKYNHDT
jgi:hypothetical protein